MGFVEVLNQLLLEKGVSRNKFCADIGIGKNSVANWEGRGNAPDGEVLIKIADYFNVSVDYLLNKKKPTALGEEQSVDAEILEMAQVIINLSPENKARIKDYLVLLKKQDNS